MTVIENELTKRKSVSLRAILRVRRAKNHNFTVLQKQVSTKGENTLTLPQPSTKQASLDRTRMWRKTTVSANNEGLANVRRVSKKISIPKNPHDPRNRLPPLTGSRWQTVLEWKGSRPETNIQSQVVKSMIGFAAVVKRVSVEADRCRTAAELLKRSCLIPEQAREATWPISGASGGGWAGRGGGGSVRGSSVLAYCGICGRNWDCRRRVTSCGRCYRGDFEIEQMPGHRKPHLCAWPAVCEVFK